jgi:Ca-activated chloride channel family protein
MTKTFAFTLAICTLGLAGCDDTKKTMGDDPSASPSSASPTKSAAPSASVAKLAGPQLTLTIAYGSEKKTWLEEQAKKFGATSPRTASGRQITIQTIAEGSGEAVDAIVNGTQKPHVFSPASGLYVGMLNSAWQKAKSATKPLAPAGDPLVLSPIVVAMWKPMAEALGWPKKALGWSDFVKVSTDAKGWGGYGHAEWGRFKLGHTHPEYSNSGLQAIVAEAYAGAKKTRGLTVADAEAKATVAFFSSVEQSIVHYGKSTGFFADKMLERGPSYVSAAVLYENLVIESYSKPNPAGMPLVAVYPVEGTFWSDHPYSVLDAPWVGPEEREAAKMFFDFLKATPQQTRALELGFRPADTKIAINAPIDEAHGVDAKQPQTLLEVPSSEVIDKLITVWRDSAKRATDVELVFDKSGSMNGKPLIEAKRGANAFIDMLHDRDDVTLLFFDGTVYPAFGPKPLKTARAEVHGRIDGTIADGRTALYDAIALAYDAAQKRSKTAPDRMHAVVVMTDGKDEGSTLQLDALKQRLSGEVDGSVKVFTIAYGDEADERILGSIAEAAKGTTAKGKPETIVDLFKDMASFF